MNHDDNKPDMQTWIEPGLEARVVAWVSGETSAFEAAELERLTGEKPELAIFKRRIEAVRGLVAEALRPDPQPLLLSPERRAKLLQVIGAPSNPTAAEKATAPVVLPQAAVRRRDWNFQRRIFYVAASLALGLFSAMSVYNFQKAHSVRAIEVPLASPDIAMDEEAEVGAPAFKMALAKEKADGNEIEARATSDGKYREKIAVEMAVRAKMEAMKRDKAQPSAKPASRVRGMSPPSGPSSVQVALPVADFAMSAGPVPMGRGGSAKSVGDFEKFEVSPYADSLQGYTASNTLAGTRINTELKDVSSAITVVTKDFLQDIGAHNNQDLLKYTTNTGVGGIRANYTIEAQRSSKDAAAEPAGSVSFGYVAPVSGNDRFLDGLSFNNAKNSNSSGGVPLNATPNQAAAAARAEEEQTIVLSPFEVSAAKDKGYNASATLAGSRLAASGSVGFLNKQIGGKKEADEPLSPPAPKAPAEAETPEVSAATEPVSTFSLHVSDVSFRLAQAALARGEAPDEASIRPEEFYNAFNYGDPAPAMSDKIGCRVEQAAHPMVQQRNLVRIAMQVAATGRGTGQPLRLTVLLDTSGSMEREDRAASVRRAMEVLTSLLGPNDRVTLIGFARQPSLLAEELPGDQAGQLLNIIAGTPAEGGTNLEEALKLAGELARRHLDPAAQNRIVLLTDGAANLGNADPAQLALAVEALRQQNISFDACGVGNAGIDDAVLEALTRKGGGRYYVLDSPEAADAGFARQLAGAFRPAAENVKVQVRFNPARVGRYRLIGFEQHRLNEEDFRNDQVQAAELAAEEAAVALYQVEVLPEGEGELGEVYVRFRDVATGTMVERSWTLAYDPRAPAFDRASPAMQLTGASALLAEKLRDGEAAEAINLKDLAGVMNTLRAHYAAEARVQDLVNMFNQARKISGE